MVKTFKKCFENVLNTLNLFTTSLSCQFYTIRILIHITNYKKIIYLHHQKYVIVPFHNQGTKL